MPAISKDLLFQAIPEVKKSKLDIDAICVELNKAFNQKTNPADDLSDSKRRAAFIAQCAHESGCFRTLVENLNYSQEGLRKVFGKYFPDDATAAKYARNPEAIANRVYANRMGNGDEASGEGWKYRGRGLIQLTGKDNYTRCGKAIGADLVIANPDYLLTIEGAVKSALWFWTANKINTFADKEDLVGMTKKINGGTHGLQERTEFYHRVLSVIS
jgi:putative chitinase